MFSPAAAPTASQCPSATSHIADIPSVSLVAYGFSFWVPFGPKLSLSLKVKLSDELTLPDSPPFNRPKEQVSGFFEAEGRVD